MHATDILCIRHMSAVFMLFGLRSFLFTVLLRSAEAAVMMREVQFFDAFDAFDAFDWTLHSWRI